MGINGTAYFMRRLAERPANLLFLLRNLFRA
jgi:proline dehydrogenase